MMNLIEGGYEKGPMNILKNRVEFETYVFQTVQVVRQNRGTNLFFFFS